MSFDNVIFENTFGINFKFKASKSGKLSFQWLDVLRRISADYYKVVQKKKIPYSNIPGLFNRLLPPTGRSRKLPQTAGKEQEENYSTRTSCRQGHGQHSGHTHTQHTYTLMNHDFDSPRMLVFSKCLRPHK